jgi:hypothetical protein
MKLAGFCRVADGYYCWPCLPVQANPYLLATCLLSLVICNCCMAFVHPTPTKQNPSNNRARTSNPGTRGTASHHLRESQFANSINELTTEHNPTHIPTDFRDRVRSSSRKVFSGISSLSIGRLDLGRRLIGTAFLARLAYRLPAIIVLPALDLDRRLCSYSFDRRPRRSPTFASPCSPSPLAA